jgi:pimeloyl-ACP methyl ester carboxylesterase
MAPIVAGGNLEAILARLVEVLGLDAFTPPARRDGFEPAEPRHRMSGRRSQRPRRGSRINLTPYRSFAVPVFFLVGRHDWQTPAVIAEAYFHRISAPCKRLVWFERSAHHPPVEEPEQFNGVLIEEVKPLVAGATDGLCRPQ